MRPALLSRSGSSVAVRGFTSVRETNGMATGVRRLRIPRALSAMACLDGCGCSPTLSFGQIVERPCEGVLHVCAHRAASPGADWCGCHRRTGPADQRPTVTPPRRAPAWNDDVSKDDNIDALNGRREWRDRSAARFDRRWQRTARARKVGGTSAAPCHKPLTASPSCG